MLCREHYGCQSGQGTERERAPGPTWKELNFHKKFSQTLDFFFHVENQHQDKKMVLDSDTITSLGWPRLCIVW